MYSGDAATEKTTVPPWLIPVQAPFSGIGPDALKATQPVFSVDGTPHVEPPQEYSAVMAPLEGGLYDGYGAIDAVGPVVALGAYEGKAPLEGKGQLCDGKLVGEGA